MSTVATNMYYGMGSTGVFLGCCKLSVFTITSVRQCAEIKYGLFFKAICLVGDENEG